MNVEVKACKWFGSCRDRARRRVGGLVITLAVPGLWGCASSAVVPPGTPSPPPFAIEVEELTIDQVQRDLVAGRYTSAQLVTRLLHRIG
ncbi:MAG: hypothetical protein HKO65_04585, partial [Gemmatimonadetes bacterium]|nr:hypothetical protein [Gemmatimonadota bacterium]